MDVEALKTIFQSLPVDFVAIILFATFITVVTLRFGASLSIAFSLALIVANVLFAAIPSTYIIGGLVSSETPPAVVVAIFAGLTVVLTFVIHRMTATLSDDSARPLFAILTGMATTVVVLAVWHMAPQMQGLWHFNEVIQGAFGASYRLYWIILGFVAFAFVKS